MAHGPKPVLRAMVLHGEGSGPLVSDLMEQWVSSWVVGRTTDMRAKRAVEGRHQRANSWE